MSHNDDFWSGSQQDRGEPTEQSPYYGDSVFDQPRQPGAQGPHDPYGQDPYGQGGYGGDPYGGNPQGDPYGADPYEAQRREEARRRVLATGPHQFDEQWGEPADPFQDPFDPNRGRQDEFSARRGRGGFMAAFIGAAILVALAAGGYAVYSVLQDTNEFEAAPVAEDTTTTTLATTTTESTTTTTLPVGMQIQLVSDQFICNGAVQEFGLITGATPNEEIAFTSPQSPNLSAGEADENGRLPIRWSCTADQVGTVWELTATGATSALSATTSFTGVPEGTEIVQQQTTTTQATTTTAGEAGEFTVVLTENPFTCDGGARVFGTLSGATPNGQISFTSPQTSGISPGTADEAGTRAMRWSCSPDQADTVWELTATDDATGRSVTFKLSGQP